MERIDDTINQLNDEIQGITMRVAKPTRISCFGSVNNNLDITN